MRRGDWYRDVVSFSAMVGLECTNVGLNTLYKAATLKGLNYHVFVVYAYGVAALVLLPSPFITHRSLADFSHKFCKFPHHLGESQQHALTNSQLFVWYDVLQERSTSSTQLLHHV